MMATGGEPEFGPHEHLFVKLKCRVLAGILAPLASVLPCGRGSTEVSAFLTSKGIAV
jgi:hypothetical protein